MKTYLIISIFILMLALGLVVAFSQLFFWIGVMCTLSGIGFVCGRLLPLRGKSDADSV